MSQHQPGWANQPQQPQQQWSAQTQPMWGAPPPPAPKKRRAGKAVGLGCLGMVGLFVIIAIAAAATSSGSKNDSSGSTASSSHSTSKGAAPAKAGAPAQTGSTDNGSAPDNGASDTVTFKVWGTAPAGELGGLDINYGSDGDTNKGTFKDGTFTGTVPFKKDAMYYSVTAQLQGSGDIQCSVTVDGHTKTGHASGGYNICDAQLSSGLFGEWS